MNFALRGAPTPLTDPKRTWHKWFAWHPVLVKESVGQWNYTRTRVVWLEHVERKYWEDYFHGMCGWSYRMPGIPVEGE